MIKENKEYWWDLIINLEERKAEIESRLPNVTQEVFDEYTLVWELLGALYKEVPNL